MTNNISVCLFDDNTQLRDSISYLLEEAEGFACVGAFKDCSNILRDITKCNPDVVLMDIDMPGINGIEAVQMIKEKFPELKILMLTVFEDDEHIYDALCAGANGYLLKSDIERIQMALQEVLNGGAPLTGSIAKRIIANLRTPFSQKLKDQGCERHSFQTIMTNE